MNLGVYGRINLENALAALATTHQMGVVESTLREAIASYSGVKRRFDVKIENENRMYIDDYAHHPEELRAFISSVREALPGKPLTGVFQPHLYSRTKDFAKGFAESLSLLDHVVLMDIYPAREEPLPGVSSRIIFDELKNHGEKLQASKEQILKVIEELDPTVLLTMGAGDIDQFVEPITAMLKGREK
ncbi:MAG: glutamate ligase domain-containing protein [Bacteroidales bacterium]